jgi:hypothetical protein
LALLLALREESTVERGYWIRGELVVSFQGRSVSPEPIGGDAAETKPESIVLDLLGCWWCWMPPRDCDAILRAWECALAIMASRSI